MVTDPQTLYTPLLKSIKHSLIYLVLTPLAAIILVSWASYQRINDFKNNQISIAQSVVKSTAQETTRVVREQKKLLNIFVENERINIKNFASDPTNTDFEDIIADKLKYYFPNYFAFTVVDQHGKLLAVDYNGYIGGICVRDIVTFAKTGKELIQVHPNPFAYHTDAIAKIGHQPEEGYFFASFSTHDFSRILALASPDDQSLMLINTETPDLIEIVEEGARNVLQRINLTLTDGEKKRILYSIPVKGTKWRLVSLHDEALFTQYNRGVISVALIVVLIFVLSSVLMIVTLCRAERQRIALAHAKEEMFSFFTHDLRSPLTSIYGTLQLLFMNADKHNFEPKTTQLISSAVENAEKMIELINDLLDVKKLESGMMSFFFERVELNKFIIDTLNHNKSLADMQSIVIEFEPIEKLYANIDKRRFQQVLTNLLSNAIKYSPKNDVVTVSLSVKDSSAILAVTDNGEGINLDVQETLFEKFTQSDSTNTHQVGGTGLGLSIVKYIVEKHGGHVSFESEMGRGTRFIVEIPLICV